MLKSVHMAFVRMTVIPIGCALGFGWSGGYQHGELWGKFLFWAGVVGALFVLPFLWRRA